MKYNLKDILIFTYVAKLCSFARASEVLSISRTVVSTRIAELEKLLGVSLLARTTRAVNLTSDGKIFFDYCNSILEKVENLDEFFYKYKGIVGILRLALPPYFSKYYIVPYLNEFLEKYPDLKLHISPTENPVNIISEGYDLQIRTHIPQEEALQIVKLMNNSEVICASKEYIKKFGKPSEPKDLLSHNCLTIDENNIWKLRNKKNNQIIFQENISGNIKCDNSEIMKELLLSGAGIAVKSIIDIEKEIVNGNLVLLLDDYEVISKTGFYAVYPAGKFVSPKVQAFIDFFQEKFVYNESCNDSEASKQIKNKFSNPNILTNNSNDDVDDKKLNSLKLQS